MPNDDNDASDLVDEPEVDNEDYNEISVPLTIILSVIGGYIMFGTVLFGLWEGWDAMTAAYYCFVTIATIGFGDVTPSFQNPSDQYKLLGTALYMLFGMATLSMCFTLVQDQMAAKARLVSNYFGSLIRRYLSSDKDKDDDGGQAMTSKDRRQKDPASMASPKSAIGGGGSGGRTHAAGTEVFEMRRRQRAARLKFQWIRQQISGKRRRGGATSGAASRQQQKRTSSVAAADFNSMQQGAGLSPKSGLDLPSSLPQTPAVMAANGSAHPVGGGNFNYAFQTSDAGSGKDTPQARGSVASRRANRRTAANSTASHDLKMRPLADISEQRL